MSEAKEQQRQARRARILEAALELFEAEGVGGLSMRAIAKRAGMPTMTLYSYFPSKIAIARALWAQAFAPLFEELDAAEAAETDPKAKLRRVAQTFVSYWLRFPDRYKIIFFIEDRRDSPESLWFIEETDVVPELLRFDRLIAAARGDQDGDYAREGEALGCGLIGITHMLVGVSEYRWADSAIYVDLILRGFL